MAIRCGLTWSETLNHTPSQLQAMSDAARRERAIGDLRSLQILTAAVAAPWAKAGGEMIENAQKALVKEIDHAATED